MASSPFDIIERKFKDSRFPEGDQPTSGWVAVTDETRSVGILTSGIFGYEHLDRNNGIIAFPLVRGNRYIFRDFDGKNIPNKLWEAEENQCLRVIELEMGLCFFNSGCEEELFLHLACFQQKMLNYFQPVEINKFKGGRPAVQDPGIMEIQYEKDSFPGVKLGKAHSPISFQGAGLFISALKRSEDDTMYVVRLYSPSNRPGRGSLIIGKRIRKLFILNLLEEIQKEVQDVEEYLQKLDVPAKKILTLGIIPE